MATAWPGLPGLASPKDVFPDSFAKAVTQARRRVGPGLKEQEQPPRVLRFSSADS